MSNKKLPKDVIDYWPEVFKDIDVKVVPLEYLDSIHVTFQNEDVWIIEFDKNEEITSEVINGQLDDLFSEYQDDIATVDFRLNTRKVKFDIQKRTRQFLKKRR